MRNNLIAIGLALALIGANFIFSRNESNAEPPSIDNVKMENGVQIVELKAKGGYLPRRSLATAGLPTIIRFDTNGTFDCSSAVRIPSLNLSKNLVASGTTDLDVGTPQVGVLKGTCSMGMYPFEVNFK
ncbi:MAG: hypothetical protein AAB453_02145 [Patescibacteria group bacterium]